MAKNDFPWIDPYYHKIKPSDAACPVQKQSTTKVKDVTFNVAHKGGIDKRPLKNKHTELTDYNKQC